MWLTMGIATVSFVLSFTSLRELAAMSAWPGYAGERAMEWKGAARVKSVGRDRRIVPWHGGSVLGKCLPSEGNFAGWDSWMI